MNNINTRYHYIGLAYNITIDLCQQCDQRHACIWTTKTKYI